MKFHHSSRPSHPEDDPPAPNWTHLDAHSDETMLARELTSELASEPARSPDFKVELATELAKDLATNLATDFTTDLAPDLTMNPTTDLTDLVAPTYPTTSHTTSPTTFQPSQVEVLSPNPPEAVEVAAEVAAEVSEAIETSMLNPTSQLPTSPPGETATDEMNGYLKEHFFRLMSQEYRTLLSTILMSAEVLEAEADELDTEERVMYEQQIWTAAEHMKNLLNEATENF